MYVRTDGQINGRTSGNSPLRPTGYRPFGAAAQKEGEISPMCESIGSLPKSGKTSSLDACVWGWGGSVIGRDGY